MEGKTSYTFSEMIEAMEPQSRRDKALIGRCVDGLSLYAAQVAMEDKLSPKIDELRLFTEILVCYWGLDYVEGAKSLESYLKAFDERVEEIRTGGVVDVDIYQTAPNVVYGLHRFGEEMVISQGIDSKDDILAVSTLIEDIGKFWDFEPNIVDDLATHLRREAAEMEQSERKAQEVSAEPEETHNPSKPPSFETGTEFWQDTLATFGREEAHGICSRYFDVQLKKKLPKNEVQFCKELFAAMYKDAVKFVDPAKLVYPYDLEKAAERSDVRLYHKSADINSICAQTIEETINASRYETNFYNLDIAAMKAINEFGFERVNMVLANTIQTRPWEGRFTNDSKKWADGVWVPAEAFKYAEPPTNPGLLDMFVDKVRKLYDELDAERFGIPGRAVSQVEGREVVGSYKIVHSIEFDNQRGFAIGHSLEAVNPFVSWQFTIEDGGARDFYWGNYYNERTDAERNFIARIMVHLDGGEIKEVRRDAKEAPSLNEAEKNFSAWLAVTESSRYKWVEDEIYHLNGRGAMYYTGGENGIYMQIRKDGTLEAGKYEGAIPHIGEATFQAQVTKQYPNFSEAYKAAMEAGGKQFMIDMFSGNEHQPLVQVRSRNGAAEKPSVLQEIREARSAPKSPAQPAQKLDKGKKKGTPEL
jgi:hypothetical protein